MKSWMALFSALFCAGSTFAPTQGTSDISEKMSQNMHVLRGYSWKMRTELKMDGESKMTSIYQIRFDLSGRMQKTLLSAPPQPKSARGIKGRKIKEKQEEMKALVESLSNIAISYILPTPERFDRFIHNADAWEGQGSTKGSVRLEGNGFASEKDQVNLYVNNVTKDFQQLSVTTELDGAPVTIQSDYRTMQGGPTYLAKMTLDYPSAGVQLVVENFDHLRQR